MTSSAYLRRRAFLLAMGSGLAISLPFPRDTQAHVENNNAGFDGYGQKHVQVRDAMWAYREKGSGPPALFLHSFLLNSDLWFDQLNGLSSIRRCIAPDLRGWGRSEPVTDFPLDYHQYARDVVTFLDAIGVAEPVDIVGMSATAFIAGLVYEMIPDRVASLTLISGNFALGSNPGAIRYTRENARNVVVDGKDFLFRRFDEYIDGPASSLHVRARYKQMILDTRTEMIVAFLNTTGLTEGRPDLPGKVQVPVLLPVGTADVVFTPEIVKERVSQFPDARLVQIEDAGRLLPLESPKRLNKALEEFWTGPAARD